MERPGNSDKVCQDLPRDHNFKNSSGLDVVSFKKTKVRLVLASTLLSYKRRGAAV
jgi:hypothetical protein